MSKMDGITATRLIKTQHPEIVVIGLSAMVKDYEVYAMQKAGAFEVLHKDNAVTELYSQYSGPSHQLNRFLFWKTLLSRRSLL